MNLPVEEAFCEMIRLRMQENGRMIRQNIIFTEEEYMDKRVVGAVVTLAAATALFVGAVHLKSPAKRFENQDLLEGDKIRLDTNGYENIQEAVRVEDTDQTVKGYVVTVKEQGYGGAIVMNVALDPEASRVLGMKVVQQSETQDLGARIAEEAFCAQFSDIEGPVYLAGTDVSETIWESLQDGTYVVRTETSGNGYADELEMTVTDGRVTGLVWDSVDEEGNRKSVLSENGQYVMTEEGLTWKEQAQALAEAVIERQSYGFLNMNDEGKTDAVTGVSISVGGFVNRLEEALLEASGDPEADFELSGSVSGTAVDGVSGATVSSTGVVNGINRALDFVKMQME